MVDIFPHLLLRICGGTFNDLEKLNLDKTFDVFTQMAEATTHRETYRTELSDAMFELIQTKNDAPDVQKKLLNIKRDVFNGRQLSAQKVTFLHENLEGVSLEKLKLFLGEQEKYDSLEHEASALFTEEMNEKRHVLKELATHENLQKGLILSSQSLQKRIHHYIDKPVEKMKKNEFNTEQSLIKYLSRLFAKTSPFSTFTNLGRSGFSEMDDAYSILDNNTEIKGHIRLNNNLYAYLKGILTSYREVYLNFYLRPNPTLTKTESNYLYLTNSNNVEAFQRIPLNPVLDVFQYLTSQDARGMRFKDLINAIIENEYIDASFEDLEAYVKQLMEYGFIEYNIGVSGIDPDWDQTLIVQLEEMNAELPLVDELMSVLKDVRQLSIHYADAQTSDRKALLDKAFEAFRTVSMKLHEAAGLPADERLTEDERKKKFEEEKAKKEAEEKGEETSETEEKKEEVFKHQTNTFFYFKPEQMFYEDSTSALAVDYNQAQLEELTGKLSDLLQEMKHFEGKNDEQARMAHFFETQYADTTSIDLLTFYEDYFRVVKKPEEEAKQKAEMEAAKAAEEAKKKAESAEENNAEEAPSADVTPEEKKEEPKKFGADALKPFQDAREKWYDTVAEKISKDDYKNGQFDLSLDFIKNLKQETPVNKENSFGSFVQFYQNNGKLNAVVNGTFSGYGKMFSRFLHILDQNVLSDLRTWNIKPADERMFVENCDASVFNANLHPPLMPFEIWMPGGQNSLPSDQQVAVTDIELHKDGDRLKLVHKPSGKEMFVFDLGFQGQMGRSQLFQLLDKFSHAEYLFASPLVSAISKGPKLPKAEETTETEPSQKQPVKAPAIWKKPRVVYENQIVLQRKGWIVSYEELPLKTNNENQWDYFKRVNEWRISHGIPEEVFVYISDRHPSNKASQNDSKAKKKLGRDDYKPQYISFKNQFLVDLFEKQLHKVSATLQIEEMLPGSKDLISVDEKRFVTEHVLQWTTRI